MNHEGWWINWETKAYLELRCKGVCHETVIRVRENQEYLGIPDEVAQQFPRYRPGTDRVDFLTFILKHTPLMRVRGHGDFVSFEYWSEDGDSKPYMMISRWILKYGGSALLLIVSNIASCRIEKLMTGAWSDFLKQQRKDEQ